VHKSTIAFVADDAEGLVVNGNHLSYQLVNFHQPLVAEIPQAAIHAYKISCPVNRSTLAIAMPCASNQ